VKTKRKLSSEMCTPSN